MESEKLQEKLALSQHQIEEYKTKIDAMKQVCLLIIYKYSVSKLVNSYLIISKNIQIKLNLYVFALYILLSINLLANSGIRS